MHYKNILAGLLVAFMVFVPVMAQDSYTVTIDANDFFRCTFLSRAQIAFNAAGNGDLTEDMINDLSVEDRAQLIANINERIAALQLELPTHAQQKLQTAGLYMAGATSLVGMIGYCYSVLQTGSNYNSWSQYSNDAWVEGFEQNIGWEVAHEKYLKRAAIFRWETGKSALMLAGAVAACCVGSLAYTLVENAVEKHDAALVELANLNGSLELINATPVVTQQ